MKKKRMFLKTHEWVEFIDETTARIGISDFAQKELGDLVFINLPEEGEEVTAGESFAEVESVKSVSDVYSPVSGIVKQINDEIMDKPELVNSDPYDSWFIEVCQISASEELMTEHEYNDFLDGEN